MILYWQSSLIWVDASNYNSLNGGLIKRGIDLGAPVMRAIELVILVFWRDEKRL